MGRSGHLNNKFRWDLPEPDYVPDFLRTGNPLEHFTGQRVHSSHTPEGKPQGEDEILGHGEIPVIVHIHIGPHQIGDGKPRDALSQTLPTALAVKPRERGLLLQILFFGIVEVDILHDGEVNLQLVEGGESGELR